MAWLPSLLEEHSRGFWAVDGVGLGGVFTEQRDGRVFLLSEQGMLGLDSHILQSRGCGQCMGQG